MNEEQILARIGDIRAVLKDIDTSFAWQVLLRDFEKWISELNGSWHMIQEEPALRTAQITKLSLEKVTEFKKEYQEELSELEDSLDKIQNPDKYIKKDFDNE